MHEFDSEPGEVGSSKQRFWDGEEQMKQSRDSYRARAQMDGVLGRIFFFSCKKIRFF